MTKGKDTISLVEYKDLESDGSNNSVFGARRARPRASRLQHNTIRGPRSAAGRRPAESVPRRGGGGQARSPDCSMLTTSEERLWGGGVSAGSGPGSGQRPPPLARRPRPLANCAAQRPPASVRLPLHLRRVRPADGARAVCLQAKGDGASEWAPGHPVPSPQGPAAPRSEPHPGITPSHPAQCSAPAPSASSVARHRGHPKGSTLCLQHPKKLPPSLQQAAQDSTFNHLSTHFAWNSWLQGRTRRSCRASKSLKHTTHLGEAAISAAPLHTRGPLPDTILSPHQAPPCPPPWAHLQGLLRLVALGVEAVGREVLDVCFGESPWLGLPQPLGQVQQRLQGDAEASSAQFRPQHSTAPGSPHPGRAIPKSPTPSPHGEAEPAYLVILHLHIIHVQV